MKMFLSLKTLKNDYVYLVLILIAAYVLTHTPFHFTGKINFVIVVFLLYLPEINKDTIFYYSLIFGLFNDFIINAYIGLSVILFIFLSLLHMALCELLSMNSIMSKLLQALLILFLFNIFILVYFGYGVRDFFEYGLLRIVLDYGVYLAIFAFLEFRRAFSYAKR